MDRGESSQHQEGLRRSPLSVAGPFEKGLPRAIKQSRNGHTSENAPEQGNGTPSNIMMGKNQWGEHDAPPNGRHKHHHAGPTVLDQNRDQEEPRSIVHHQKRKFADHGDDHTGAMEFPEKSTQHHDSKEEPLLSSLSSNTTTEDEFPLAKRTKTMSRSEISVIVKNFLEANDVEKNSYSSVTEEELNKLVDLPTFIYENQTVFTFPEKLMLMLTYVSTRHKPCRGVRRACSITKKGGEQEAMTKKNTGGSDDAFQEVPPHGVVGSSSNPRDDPNNDDHHSHQGKTEDEHKHNKKRPRNNDGDQEQQSKRHNEEASTTGPETGEQNNATAAAIKSNHGDRTTSIVADGSTRKNISDDHEEEEYYYHHPAKCIFWGLNGKALVIGNKEEMISKIMPLFFFQEAKTASFVRKLYRWGFRRLPANFLTVSSAFSDEEMLVGASGGVSSSWWYKTKKLLPVGKEGISFDNFMVFVHDSFQRKNRSLLMNMKSVTAETLRNRTRRMIKKKYEAEAAATAVAAANGDEEGGFSSTKKSTTTMSSSSSSSQSGEADDDASLDCQHSYNEVRTRHQKCNNDIGDANHRVQDDNDDSYGKDGEENESSEPRAGVVADAILSRGHQGLSQQEALFACGGGALLRQGEHALAPPLGMVARGLSISGEGRDLNRRRMLPNGVNPTTRRITTIDAIIRRHRGNRNMIDAASAFAAASDMMNRVHPPRPLSHHSLPSSAASVPLGLPPSLFQPRTTRQMIPQEFYQQQRIPQQQEDPRGYYLHEQGLMHDHPRAAASFTHHQEVLGTRLNHDLCGLTMSVPAPLAPFPHDHPPSWSLLQQQGLLPSASNVAMMATNHHHPLLLHDKRQDLVVANDPIAIAERLGRGLVDPAAVLPPMPRIRNENNSRAIAGTSAISSLVERSFKTINHDTIMTTDGGTRMIPFFPAAGGPQEATLLPAHMLPRVILTPLSVPPSAPLSLQEEAMATSRRVAARAQEEEQAVPVAVPSSSPVPVPPRTRVQQPVAGEQSCPFEMRVPHLHHNDDPTRNLVAAPKRRTMITAGGVTTAMVGDDTNPTATRMPQELLQQRELMKVGRHSVVTTGYHGLDLEEAAAAATEAAATAAVVNKGDAITVEANRAATHVPS